MQDLFTLDAARGQSIARALIEVARGQARLVKSSRLHWHTYETNLTAMKLFDKITERSGFVVYRLPI